MQKKLSNKLGFPPTMSFEFPQPKRFLKIVMWGKSKEEISILMDKLQKDIPNIETVTSGGESSTLSGLTIEITAKGATKGEANAYLASKILQLDPKTETLHIGDTMNDHTTARFQRFVALKNADKLTKSFATHIADKNTNSGVAKVLRGEYKKLKHRN